MRTNILRGLALSAAAALALTACASPNSGDVVSANQAQVAQSVNMGTITGSRAVTVQGGNKPGEVVGTIAGGIVGGLLGNEIGKGTGNVLATGAGATAGAAVGNRVAGSATQQASTEWFVRLDSGQNISVIQASPAFAVGQRVQVVQSGNGVTRLVP
ncbi:glycine zipper 2TM domain-containing protein [Amaricoccus solimangrovi]|nr:glycine zipper 2TM domain-containing protein [Amaricoccus solimangrovi]